MALEELMIGRAIWRDPFEGPAAYRRRIRIGIEGFVALGLAIVACGLVLAMWFRVLQPLFERLIAG
jgi:hypothetical protein